MTLERMFRAVIAKRRFCSSTNGTTTVSLGKRVSAELEKLMDADWVDTDDDKTIDLVVESAGSLINEYRQHYNPNDFDEKLYKKVALLYEAKEAASIVEAYACLAENVMRHHEGMVGYVVGNNTEIPEGEGEKPLEIMRDYIRLMNTLEDGRVRDKVEMELGRKMVHLKSMLSLENFGAHIAPIAGDRILPITPKPKNLPKEPDQKLSPSSQAPS